MPASHLCTTMHDANNLGSRSLVQLKLCTDGSARHVWHLPSQEKADAMITHLASLADQRLIISFAPFTPYYAVLKRIGELFPGPSKVFTVLSLASLHSSRPVSECCIRGGSRARISRHRALGSISNTVIPIAFQAAPCRARGALRPPQILHVCHFLSFPVRRRPPERTCTQNRTWKPPWSELASRCARPRCFRLQCMRLVPQSKSALRIMPWLDPAG